MMLPRGLPEFFDDVGVGCPELVGEIALGLEDLMTEDSNSPIPGLWQPVFQLGNI